MERLKDTAKGSLLEGEWRPEPVLPESQSGTLSASPDCCLVIRRSNRIGLTCVHLQRELPFFPLPFYWCQSSVCYITNQTLNPDLTLQWNPFSRKDNTFGQRDDSLYEMVCLDVVEENISVKRRVFTATLTLETLLLCPLFSLLVCKRRDHTGFS